MGKVKEIVIDIEEMLLSGCSVEQVARILKCPIEWVEQIQEDLREEPNPEDMLGMNSEHFIANT